jgi:hypothetical protein
MGKSINKVRVTALILGILAIAFAFFTRIVSIFEYVTFDIGPDPDQISGGYFWMDMWKGNFPQLGPAGGGGKYGFVIPPLYGYLAFPLTIFGADPEFQVLTNGLFSFLSIPLLIYFVYQLLENVEQDKRLLLSSLAGFWYSTIYADYFINNFSWAPSPIPFFLLVFALLYRFQMETSKPLLYQAIAWIFFGITVAILVSLHTTTMLIIPVTSVIASLWFVYQNRKNTRKCLLPFLSIISANLALFMYWHSEIVRNFANTRGIVRALTAKGASGEPSSNLFTRLFKAIWETVYLGNQVFFLNDNISIFNVVVSVIFFGISLYIVIKKYRGNKTLIGFLAITWIIFLYASSNYPDEHFYSHRKILLWFAPILLAIASLAYLNFTKTFHRILALFLAIIIGYSIATNLYFNQRYLASKYGSERLLSVADTVEIINQIPAGSTLCDPAKKGKRKEHGQYDYIDTFMTKRELTITNACPSGSYYIQPKFKMAIQMNDLFPIFTLAKTPPLDRRMTSLLETPEAYLYKIE